MKTVSPQTFDLAPWMWLLVPLLCLVLLRVADAAQDWRDAAVRFTGNALVIAGCSILAALALSQAPW